jgi:hypothetical protein
MPKDCRSGLMHNLLASLNLLEVRSVRQGKQYATTLRRRDGFQGLRLQGSKIPA